MKKSALIILTVICTATISCKRKATCTCTETYVGAVENYEIENDTVFHGLKKEDAKIACDKKDKPTQTILTESYTVECEIQ